MLLYNSNEIPGELSFHAKHDIFTRGDVRRKFRIEPLKETNLGVAQPFFDP